MWMGKRESPAAGWPGVGGGPKEKVGRALGKIPEEGAPTGSSGISVFTSPRPRAPFQGPTCGMWRFRG